MRKPRSFSSMFIASAIVVFGVLTAFAVSAQAPGQSPAPAPVGPYKPVDVKPPAAMTDPSFTTFRKQLAGIAEKRDRAALARLISANFFWTPAGKDIADKRKPPIDTLAKALGLDGKDAPGWFTLSLLAQEASAAPYPERPGVICAAAPPTYDPKAFQELIKTTQTSPLDWGYPIRAGLEVRAAAKPGGAVVEKLGLHLVRMLQEDQPASDTMIKVATPSGKTGYVAEDLLRDLVSMLICYVKEGNSWKIAGYTGGDAEGTN
jgi:hypothetical protein